MNGTLLVSHTTVGNVPFARNWCALLHRARATNYVLIATDDGAAEQLGADASARGHLVRWPYDAQVGASAGSLTYRSKGWTRLMFAVPRMLRWVLELGYDVLWCDTDVAAVGKPWPVVHALASAAPPVDFLGSVDGRVPPTDLGECARRYSVDRARWGASAGTSKLCGGLFYARATPRTIAFAAAWERRVSAPGAGAKNQPHFNAALDAAKLPLRLLPCDLFPNGYRYASGEWRAAQRRGPLLVHNNWIKGHAAKRERFERWGLWAP